LVDLKIDVVGLEKVVQKMAQFPAKLKIQMKRNMMASLDVLQENVPPYPQPPANSTYKRTGTLGKSIGGGTMKPAIYNVTGSGMDVVGKYGTKLSYAKYVIDPEQQAYMHRGRWWTTETMVEKAKNKIIKIWNDMVKTLLSK
jgi:hypothetical protein